MLLLLLLVWGAGRASAAQQFCPAVAAAWTAGRLPKPAAQSS